MAKKKFSLEFEGLEDLLEQFNDLQDVVPIATKALEATHAHITPKIHEHVQKPYLPAKGKYSRGRVEKQIIDKVNIEWQGLVGKVDVGFSLDEGIVPIFLINGTCYMNPARGLKSAIYGKKTKAEIAEIQEEIFTKEIAKVMSSGK